MQIFLIHISDTILLEELLDKNYFFFQGYQSITGLYSDIVREPITLKENKDNMLMEEVKVLKNIMEEIDSKQARLARENELLKEQMKNMLSKIVELENKLR